MPYPRSPLAVGDAEQPRREGPGLRLDGLAVAALIIVAFLILQSLLDRQGKTDGAAPSKAGETAESDRAPRAAPETAPKTAEEAPPLPPPAPDPSAIVYPYDDYWLTQGVHGFSYGHMAIDLAAGKGAAIKSPIHGTVTANFIDQYGNTTLLLENDVYTVTLLHGNYVVQVGQQVSIGDLIGTEGNNGYTTDMQGRSCRNRDCGYHSHLNVYSKVLQTNVNPLEVLR